jgi:hypothetical protein
MNISGREYSRSTVGLRQPKKILDQHFKLVFIYPLLTDSKLDKYTELIRSFIATSMLKEIQTSNALNIISMASSISPLIDELGQVVDVSATGNSTIRQTMRDMVTRSVQDTAKYEVEKRVREKTQHIEKLLNIDPQLAQYKPILQMITLNNFIDVPIVVGTRAFDIESIVFLFIFAIAISSNGKLSLNSSTDVERMFNILKQMNTNNINNILNTLLSGPAKNWFERRQDWISKHPKLDRFLKMRPLFLLQPISPAAANWQPLQQAGRAIQTTAQRVGLGVTRPQPNLPSGSPPSPTQNIDTVNPDFADMVYDVNRNGIRQAQINFRNVLDPSSMARQFGYSPEQGQLKHTFDRINPRINQVFNLAQQYFSEVLWPSYISRTLASFLYVITPRTSGININDLLIGMLSGSNNPRVTSMVDPIIEYIRNDFKTALNSNLETKGPEQADIILAGIRNFCDTTFEGTTSLIRRMNDLNTNALTGVDFSSPDFINYESEFERVVTVISAHTLTLDKLLRDIFPNAIVNDILGNRTTDIINNSINSVIDYLRTFTDFPMQTAYVLHTGIANPIDAEREITHYIAQSKKQLIFFIRYLFLHTIQYILCEYVKETKVAVETTKHDVMDQNNFTVVTSLELIMALANAFAAKSYNDLLNKDSRGEQISNNTTLIRHLNQNYVRGVVTYMINQLNVPNMFVIDEETQTVYYQLMYQSNVNTIKLNTMQTFVQNILR